MTSTVAASRGGAGSRSSSMASPQQRPAGYGGGVSQAEDRNAGVPRSSFMQVRLRSSSNTKKYQTSDKLLMSYPKYLLLVSVLTRIMGLQQVVWPLFP